MLNVDDELLNWGASVATTFRAMAILAQKAYGMMNLAEANRAMAWLRQAIAAGYKKVAMLKQDSDLDALRDRADFRKVIADLEAQAEKK